MAQKTTLDRTDFEILGALQNDARISNKELAALIELAPSSCLERVRRLQSAGVIKGFHADINPEAFNAALEAIFSIRVRGHSRDQIDRFMEHAGALPETLNVFHIAGVNDFLVHVAVRDAAHLRDLALDAFTGHPEVDHMETTLVFTHTKSHLTKRAPDLESR